MRRADKIFAFSMITFLILYVLGMAIYADHLEGRVEDYKLQILQKNDQIYERQLKYEEAQSSADRLGKELVDAQNRLASAAEREKAARARASRSRSFGGSRASKPRSAALFDGAVHDITMYCPTGNTTASGKWPRRGMVATISRAIPFGTRVSIEGLGEFVVEDRIGHGSEFDIFTPSCGEADRFGRKHRRVTILDTD